MNKTLFTLAIVIGFLWAGKINAQCTADFNRNPRTVCVGSPVVFYDLSTGGNNPKTWNWNFGPGATPATFNGQNPPTVTYSTTGTKTITLTYTTNGGSCTDVQQRDVDVVPQPTVTFTSNSPQCVGQYFDFTYTGSAALTYVWDFGVGAIPNSSSVQNPQGIIYSSSGIKTVTLTINNGTCTQSTTQTITVSTTPVAGIASTAPQCTGIAVDFTNTGTTSGVTYAWDFGSGATPATSTAQNPTGIIYSTSGIKTISLIVTNSSTGCAVTASNTINIHETPVSNFSSNSPVCENTDVNFTNSSTTGIGVSYSWDFGAGAAPVTSTAQNPNNILYSSSGTKTVTLTVTNEFQCAVTSSSTVEILATPQVSFTSTAPKCTGLTVDFTNTGTNSGVTYAWDFGSGATPATSTAQNPTGIIYSTSGIKTISLIVTNSSTGCAVTASNTINIHETPVSNFSSNSPVCENTDVNFTNSSTTGIGVSYSWDFGAGAAPVTSTAQNPNNILYSSSGTKTVTLTVTNEFQCAVTSSSTIEILVTPQVSFTSTAPKCTGLTVDFTNTGTNSGVTYAWDFGSGAAPATSTDQDPAGVIYSTSGVKNVVLTTTNSSTGCAVTASNTININLTPSVSFTSTAPQCVESGVDFTNTGSSGENWTYLWDFGQDGLPGTANSENPVGIIYNSGGNKLVTLTISDGTCTHIDTNIIFINSLPIADAGKDTTICANRSVQIGTLPDSGYAYTWFPSSTLNDATIANPISSPIAYITNYVVTVRDTLTGCINSDSVIVTMLPPLAALAGIDGEICRNESFQIGAALIEGQSYNWLPVSGLDNPVLPNPVATPDSTTTYTLTVTGSGCDAVMDEVTVLVHQLPEIYAGADDSITVGSSTQLMAEGGVQYTWSPAYSLNNYGIYNPIASPIVTTQYSVIGIDVYGCKNSDSVLITVIDPSVWVPSSFTPDNNGLNDIFYVRGEGINNFEFRIFDRWGYNIFYSKDIHEGWDGKQQITGEDAPNGAYVYVVKGVKTNGEVVDLKGLVNLIR